APIHLMVTVAVDVGIRGTHVLSPGPNVVDEACDGRLRGRGGCLSEHVRGRHETEECHHGEREDKHPSHLPPPHLRVNDRQLTVQATGGHVRATTVHPRIKCRPLTTGTLYPGPSTQVKI